MKSLTALFFILSLGLVSHADKVDVNVQAQVPQDTNTNPDRDTTLIQIQKGSSIKSLPDQKQKFEITDGHEDITGDGAILTKQAKENWKKACKDWKAELKENNKGNQVLSSNCGAPTCSPETNETVCKSTATYKLKIKMDE